jgi:hypothetical protein
LYPLTKKQNAGGVTIMKLTWSRFNKALWVMAIGWLVLYSLGYGGRDVTDSKQSRDRSGMAIYNDYGTGCEYLKGGLFGGLYPRMDEHGDHKCDGIRTHND